MQNFYQIPTTPSTPQRFKVRLGTVDYQITLTWCQAQEGGWIMDIADATGTPIVNGIPLVTGIDLLSPYDYLGFAGRMWVMTTSAPDAPPTFDNLGTDSFLYWVTGDQTPITRPSNTTPI